MQALKEQKRVLMNALHKISKAPLETAPPKYSYEAIVAASRNVSLDEISKIKVRKLHEYRRYLLAC
jgi:hypothetical protein